jgi:hypothetical protein
MGLIDAFKKEADKPYCSLDELPNRRNIAIFSIRHGKQVITSSCLSMDSTGIEVACRLVRLPPPHHCNQWL